jgi:hypothetical protein
VAGLDQMCSEAAAERTARLFDTTPTVAHFGTGSEDYVPAMRPDLTRLTSFAASGYAAEEDQRCGRLAAPKIDRCPSTPRGRALVGFRHGGLLTRRSIEKRAGAALLLLTVR